MAGTSTAPAQTAAATITRLIRVAFPHDRFPDGPYERAAAAVLAAADEDLRLRAQLDQGLRDLDAAGAAPFTALDDAAALTALEGMADTVFFKGIRAKVITT